MVYLAYNSRLYFIIAGKLKWQELQADSHISTTVKNSNTINANMLGLICFLTSYSSGSPT